MVTNRVLHVFSTLNRGGAETFLMNIYRNINHQKYQFDFVVCNKNQQNAYEKEITKLGGRIFFVPRFTIINIFCYITAWRSLLMDHPEWLIIHAHHTTPAFIYLKIAKSFGRITIAHSHTSGCEKTIKSVLKIIFRHFMQNSADYLVACSDSAARWMYGINSTKKPLILKNAIDIEQYSYSKEKRNNIRKKLGIEDKTVFGHVGRFTKEKNQKFLIEVFNSIHKRIENSFLILVGDGPQKAEIEKLVLFLKLQKNVLFTGISSSVNDLMQAMDFFILPSKFEGLPLTLIEAQTSGLIIFASDTITKEVKITDLVTFLSLSENASFWADEILKKKDSIVRDNHILDIRNAGYDVHENAALFQDFYDHIISIS